MLQFTATGLLNSAGQSLSINTPEVASTRSQVNG